MGSACRRTTLTILSHPRRITSPREARMSWTRSWRCRGKMWDSGRRTRTRVAGITLVATGLIPTAPVADEGGGSFRLPDLFGSWASIPAAPREHMRNRLLLASIVSLSAVVGAAEHALAATFSEFPIPTANSSPNDITAGPDGALWFTEGTANKIGRVSTSGVIT